jgi:hypothetical protein
MTDLIGLSPSLEVVSCSVTPEFRNIFKELEGSCPCSQALSTGLYPKSDASCPTPPSFPFP